MAAETWAENGQSNWTTKPDSSSSWVQPRDLAEPFPGPVEGVETA